MLDSVASQCYSWVLVTLTTIGVVVNLGSLVLLSTRKRRQSSRMFHVFLRILAVYDLVVILGCSLLYALPDLSSWYAFHIYPRLLPMALPVVQIAMMSSVYCTVVMSFERYIRICKICQLRGSDALTQENLKYYVAGFVVAPIVFYMPKFYEVRAVCVSRDLVFDLDCASLLNNASHILLHTASIETVLKASKLRSLCVELASSNVTNTTLENTVHRFTIPQNVVAIEPTQLRRDPVYYHVYSVFLNTVFASVIPLVSLAYLNICTVRALRRSGENSSFLRRATGSISSRDREQDGRGHVGVHRGRGQKPSISSAIERSRVLSVEGESMELPVVLASPDPSVSNTDSPRRVDLVTTTTRRRGGTKTTARARPLCLEMSERRLHRCQPLSVTRGGQERRLTRISLAIVSLYIVCHMWRLVPTVYEVGSGASGRLSADWWPLWLEHVHHISHTLIVFNSAVNFLLYVVL